MTDRYPSAFLLSATLHGVVLALLLLMTYALNRPAPDAPKIFELVAGEGNNYIATKAPAVGSPDVVKVNVPAPPVAKPEPAKPEAAPITPEPAPKAAPVTPTPAPKTVTTPKAPRTPAQEIRHLLANADVRAKREVKKEREEEAKRLTKEEFDRLNKARTEKSPSPKIAKIDGPGIPKGVAGGSPDNKDGGANGKALESDEGSALERYFSLLRSRLLEALEKPAGLSDTLVTTVQFTIAADGTLSNVRLVKPSGSAEFDAAVRAAFRRVGSIGKRPDGKSEVLELDFRAKEQDGD